MAYDQSGFNRKMQKMLDLKETVMPQAYAYFKSITPKRSGNARNKTQLSANTIVTKYSYAGPLDSGSSKQNKLGMTAPTKKEIQRLISKYVRKLG